jgi:integrase
MSAKQLTSAACKKFAPGRDRRRIRDASSRSLFLIVEPSGHKSFQMRFRVPDGRIRKLTLGPFDASDQGTKDAPVIGQPLTLAAARTLAAEVLRQRELGRDPALDHRARKHRRRLELKEKHDNTFAVVAHDYVREHVRPHMRRWPEVAGLLGLQYSDDDGTKLEVIAGSLAERWADRPLSSIDDHDVFAALDEAKKIGVPGRPVRNRGLSDARARALFTALSSLFNWARRHRRTNAGNPCSGLRPANAVARDRVLNNAELVWFWKAADGEPLVGPLLKLLLLTGARLNEVAGMRWSELSEDGGTWRIPKERTKNKRAHTVPLPPMAQALIESVPRLAGSDLLFTTTLKTPVSGWSRTKRRLDRNMLAIARKDKRDAVIAPWRLHDLRRVFVTGLAELGVRGDVIELAVNHVSGSRGGIAGVYNRSELMDERREAFKRWANHVTGLVSKPANVVRLSGKRAK